jgi:hypothetical protein
MSAHAAALLENSPEDWYETFLREWARRHESPARYRWCFNVWWVRARDPMPQLYVRPRSSDRYPQRMCVQCKESYDLELFSIPTDGTASGRAASAA